MEAFHSQSLCRFNGTLHGDVQKNTIPHTGAMQGRVKQRVQRQPTRTPLATPSQRMHVGTIHWTDHATCSEEQPIGGVGFQKKRLLDCTAHWADRLTDTAATFAASVKRSVFTGSSCVQTCKRTYYVDCIGT